MLRFQLATLGALTVGVVVSIMMVVFFKFGDESFNREGGMVVKGQGTAGEAELVEEDGKGLDDF